MYDILIFLTLVSLGFIAGTIAEKRHYRSIMEREARYSSMVVSTMEPSSYRQGSIRNAKLVMGSTVVSIDYFKRLVAILRSLVGGEVVSYTSLIDRARRESVLRMIESANGADMIMNLRIETSTIGNNANNKNTVGSIEVVAYGTALYLNR